MRRDLKFFLSAIVLAACFNLQGAAQEIPDTAIYAVSYIEVMPASRTTALTLLRQYREASRREQGFIRAEFFEQIGRAAHFCIIETWSDQRTVDVHTASASTKDLLSKLQPIRLSDYDQRPYKTLTVVPAAAAGNDAVYVITHVDIGGPAGEVPALLRRLADTSRQERGNVRFDVLLHTMRANHFTVIETWQNGQMLDAHAAATHTREYRDALQPMLGSPLDERLYKAVE